MPSLSFSGLRRVASVGECMVEVAPDDDSGRYALGFAGDSFNTAWYMRQLRPDLAVRFVSRVGRDGMSNRLLAFAARSGIDTDHIGRSADRTVGLYVIALDNGERSFSYWRDRSAARCLADDATALEAALAGMDLIYFSGITMAILSPPARAVLVASIRAARSAGARVAFDPNLRPRLWSARADMRAGVTAAAAVSDVVLPSFEDEAAHFGDGSPEATLDRYRAGGAAGVIVKNGAAPIAYDWDGAVGMIAPPPNVPIVDSTAAGDSFNAALFVALSRGRPIAEAVAAASVTAAHVVQHRGALVPLPQGSP